MAIPIKQTPILTGKDAVKFNEEMEFFASLGKSFRFRDIKPEEQDPTWQSEDIFLFVCQRRS